MRRRYLWFNPEKRNICPSFSQSPWRCWNITHRMLTNVIFLLSKDIKRDYAFWWDFPVKQMPGFWSWGQVALATKALKEDKHTFHTFLISHRLCLAANLKHPTWFPSKANDPTLFFPPEFQLTPRLSSRSQWIFRNYFRQHLRLGNLRCLVSRENWLTQTKIHQSCNSTVI